MTKDINQVSGMLSDIDIRKCFGNDIKIYTNYKEGEFKFDLNKQLQLASIDLRFRNECKRFKDGLSSNLTYEMLKNHEYTVPFELSNNEKLVINPGEVILTTTLETICISSNYAGIITGRSSIARLGIMVHCCQEFVNPGQGAPIALQIINLGKNSVELDLKVPICQLILFRLSIPASNLYNVLEKSKYKNEVGITNSKIYEESIVQVLANTTETNSIKWYKKGKTFLKKYIEPFCPSVIMLLLITPLFNNFQNTAVSNIIDYIEQMSISVLFLMIIIIIYIICRKEN